MVQKQNHTMQIIFATLCMKKRQANVNNVTGWNPQVLIASNTLSLMQVQQIVLLCVSLQFKLEHQLWRL